MLEEEDWSAETKTYIKELLPELVYGGSNLSRVINMDYREKMSVNVTVTALNNMSNSSMASSPTEVADEVEDHT